MQCYAKEELKKKETADEPPQPHPSLAAAQRVPAAHLRPSTPQCIAAKPPSAAATRAPPHPPYRQPPSQQPAWCGVEEARAQTGCSLLRDPTGKKRSCRFSRLTRKASATTEGIFLAEPATDTTAPACGRHTQLSPLSPSALRTPLRRPSRPATGLAPSSAQCKHDCAGSAPICGGRTCRRAQTRFASRAMACWT